MTDSLVAAVIARPEGQDGSSDGSASAGSSSPSPAGGTGVFIPACILDGSALTNPAIAAKFPRRQRRGSAPLTHAGPAAADTGKQQQQHNSSPSSRSESAAVAATGAERSHGSRAGRNHGPSHSTSAKNPFAATPRNIRQQQLLCNLMAAADSFPDTVAAGGGGGGGGPSRGASLDYGNMPPPAPCRGASLDYSNMPPPAPSSAAGRSSMDVSSMTRAASRTSLDSYGWGYMSRGRSSCDMSARQSVDNSYAGTRQSMESYGGPSMRSSMDHNSCWSGRPSIDSTFSCYAPMAASPQLLAQQQQQVAVTAAAAAAAAAAAVATRASFEPALPPTPAGATINRMGFWQPGRHSYDMASLTSPSAPATAFSRYSLDGPGSECQAAAAAAAAASALQAEQQRSMNGIVRYDSSAMSNVSSGSMDSRVDCCTPGPATPADVAAIAASMAARRNQMAQLQQIIDSMTAANSGTGAGISTDTAAALAVLSAQGISPDVAALLLLQAQQNGSTSANASSSNGLAPEAILFQQQLQHIMQANQMAASAAASAASAAAASKLYGNSSTRAQQQQQQQQAASQRWQYLNVDAGDTDLLQDGGAPLTGAVNAANLQQQLELLQHMQL